MLLRVTEPDTVELKVLPRLGLTEALEAYRIEAPIDHIGEAPWQDPAAGDVLETPDG